MKINKYAAAFIVGGSISILLTNFSKAVPDQAVMKLPIGGGDFEQSAIIVTTLLAVVAILDVVKRGD
jgi:hypothetical protein